MHSLYTLFKNRAVEILLFTGTLLFLFSCNQEISNSESVKDTASKFKEMTTNKTQTGLRFSSMVRSILHDSKGNYWFGSDQEGVCKYDGKTFTYFTTAEGMTNDQVRTIQEDQHGDIWFATGDGVCKYDGEKIIQADNLEELVRLPKTKSKWASDPDDLWFNGEFVGGIYRFDGERLSILDFPFPNPIGESNTSISGTVTGICKGKNNMLWMANYNGVLGYDGKDFKFINEAKYQYHVRSIYEDSRGNLWIGNNGIGALIYDGHSTISLVDLLKNQNGQSVSEALLPYPAPMHIFSIAEDKDGSIWFGDRDTGAWKFDGNKLINFKEKGNPTNKFVRVIYKDNNDLLWFGLDDGKVCTYDGKKFEMKF